VCDADQDAANRGSAEPRWAREISTPRNAVPRNRVPPPEQRADAGPLLQIAEINDA